MEKSSVFGGTLALAEIFKQKEEGFGFHNVRGCACCRTEINDEHAAWVTDQCIKQGLSHERQADPLI